MTLAVVLASVVHVHAGEPDPQTGRAPWVLDSNNWQLGEELLPEPVLQRVKRGDYSYRVVPVDPERFKQNYSQRFWDASAANAGKFDVDAETCGLKDVATGEIPEFYFGYPFPTIERDDPRLSVSSSL
jgi:hypothetical protein